MTQLWNSSRDGDIGAAFDSASQLDIPSSTLEARRLLVNMVYAWTARKMGGVIIAGPSKKHIAIEFYGAAKEPNGTPSVQIQYVVTPSQQRAEAFLRGETVETIPCNDADSSLAFSMILEHLKRSAVGQGHVDIVAGCPILEGVIVPMPVGV